MGVCEECGTEDDGVKIRYTEDDAFPLCDPCAKVMGLPTANFRIIG